MGDVAPVFLFVASDEIVTVEGVIVVKSEVTAANGASSAPSPAWPPRTMRASVLHGPGRVVLEDRTVQVPGPYEV